MHKHYSLLAAATMVGVAVGFLLGASMVSRIPLGTDASIEWHWKRVNDYRELANNPRKYREQFETDFGGLPRPYDIEHSLLALDNEGEIYCADLLLPTVPENSRINRHWMKYLGEHPDVLYAHGLPVSAALPVTGDQPLYMKIWFKKTALPVIQKLIVDLEEMARDGKTDSPSGEPQHSTP